MTDEGQDIQEGALAIYVNPTEEGKPPSAQLGLIGECPNCGRTHPLMNETVRWSPDSGAWVAGDESTMFGAAGMPVPEEVGEAITAHAKDLGVEW